MTAKTSSADERRVIEKTLDDLGGEGEDIAVTALRATVCDLAMVICGLDRNNAVYPTYADVLMMIHQIESRARVALAIAEERKRATKGGA
jgi:hypothetical protein